MQQFEAMTLRRNFTWTLIGNIVYAACQWGMLIMIAKLGSPEMVGQFTLGLAVTAPIIAFSNLQLRAIQATDAKYQYLFSDYLGLRLIATGLALIVIMGIAFISGYQGEASLIVLAVGLTKALESLSDVFYGLIQQHERMDRIAISMMIKGPLSLLLLGLGIYLTRSVLGGVIGLSIALALVLILYDVSSGASILNSLPKLIQSDFQEVPQTMLLRPRWNFRILGQLVWLAMPLGIVMMLISLYSNIPRYFIAQYFGERELGIFSAISYLMVAGNMVINALGQSASPRLAKHYAARNGIAFSRLILKLTGIALSLGVMGILATFLAGPKLLSLLYKPEYAEYTNILTWLMVASGILYVEAFLSYGMTAARYFRVQIPLFLVFIAVTTLACIELIPSQGLLGAAIALIIGSVVRCIGTFSVIVYALSKLGKTLEVEQI